MRYKIKDAKGRGNFCRALLHFYVNRGIYAVLLCLRRKRAPFTAHFCRRSIIWPYMPPFLNGCGICGGVNNYYKGETALFCAYSAGNVFIPRRGGVLAPRRGRWQKCACKARSYRPRPCRPCVQVRLQAVCLQGSAGSAGASAAKSLKVRAWS